MDKRSSDRLGLKEEDIARRGEGPGIAALFEAMSDGGIRANGNRSQWRCQSERF